MKCAVALSTARSPREAREEVLNRVTKRLDSVRGDLAFVFASVEHADDLAELASEVLARGLARHVLGCTGESIIGEDREVEDGPALSLWVIQLPGVPLCPVRLSFREESFGGWDELAAEHAGPGQTLLLIADPFSFPTDAFLKQINAHEAGLQVIGGMASAGQAPGVNRLVSDDAVLSEGAVGVLIERPGVLQAVVSQGCRPVGRPMLITRAEGNMIRELGRRPALDVLREQFEALDPADQQRVQQGLHIGRVINEYQESFQRGDFLVRNVLGADDSGGIAITDLVRVGQTVQFHVRDAETADQDLHTLLEQSGAAEPPAGALIFSCNGRGTRLFPQPNHDLSALHQRFGPVPAAGFFAMGEIGPVGGQNFVHGFTASMVLFKDQEGPGSR